MATRKTKAEKALDNQIDALYREHCCNIQISILDIPRVFAHAKQAHAEGKDLKEAIVSFVNSIRKN